MPNWNSSAPYEVIASPATLYMAPALTARPAINEHPISTPTAPWVLIGTSGELNYDEAGIAIAQPQEVTKWRSLGDTGSRKAFRTSEDFAIRVTVVDLTLEQWKHAINENTITEVAPGANAGTKKLGLSRGPGVASRAILVRFPSPYGADLWAQIWLPIAINMGSSEFSFRKDTPAGLALEFEAMVNSAAASEDERFGVVECQDEEPAS